MFTNMVASSTTLKVNVQSWKYSFKLNYRIDIITEHIVDYAVKSSWENFKCKTEKSLRCKPLKYIISGTCCDTINFSQIKES